MIMDGAVDPAPPSAQPVSDGESLPAMAQVPDTQPAKPDESAAMNVDLPPLPMSRKQRESMRELMKVDATVQPPQHPLSQLLRIVWRESTVSPLLGQDLFLEYASLSPSLEKS